MVHFSSFKTNAFGAIICFFRSFTGPYNYEVNYKDETLKMRPEQISAISLAYLKEEINGELKKKRSFLYRSILARYRNKVRL